MGYPKETTVRTTDELETRGASQTVQPPIVMNTTKLIRFNVLSYTTNSTVWGGTCRVASASTTWHNGDYAWELVLGAPDQLGQATFNLTCKPMKEGGRQEGFHFHGKAFSGLMQTDGRRPSRFDRHDTAPTKQIAHVSSAAITEALRRFKTELFEAMKADSKGLLNIAERQYWDSGLTDTTPKARMSRISEILKTIEALDNLWSYRSWLFNGAELEEIVSVTN